MAQPLSILEDPNGSGAADRPSSRGPLTLVGTAIRRLAGRRATETGRDAASPSVAVAEFTHIGRRDENQDRLGVFRDPLGKPTLLVVADGLGGHSGGALAAQTVIATAERCWASPDRDPDSETFLNALARECHDAVNQARNTSGLDPRSTLAALLVHEPEIVSIHAGDSRVMQFSSVGLMHRTIDHSVAQLKVMMGSLSEEEQSTHSTQARLFSHVGGESAPDTDIQRWDLADGHRFVVCSDGFWEIFPPAEILEIFDASDRMAELQARFAKKLEHLENQDNTTAILVEIDLSGPRPPAEGARGGIRSLLRRARPYAAPVLFWMAAFAHGAVESAYGQEGPWLLAQVVEREPAEDGARTGQVESETTEFEEGPRPPGNPTEQSQDPDSQPAPDVPLPIEYVQIEVNREIGEPKELPGGVAEELRNRGKLDSDSELTSSDAPRQLADSQVVRLRQAHKGLPVYGAEVTVTTQEGRIVKIRGYPVPTIEVDTSPPNSYPATVALASRLLGRDIERREEGTLVIFPVEDGQVRLAWEGLVRIEDSEERVVFDAENGKILLRRPVIVGP